MFVARIPPLVGVAWVLAVTASVRAETASEITEALNKNDARAISASVPSHTYEFYWNGGEGSFAVSRDRAAADDAVTINDSVPITCSALYQVNELPEISITARRPEVDQLEITFILRPPGNTVYEGTIKIDLTLCPCEAAIQIVETDWSAQECKCRGTGSTCYAFECDQMMTCAGVRKCKWTTVYSIDA